MAFGLPPLIGRRSGSPAASALANSAGRRRDDLAAGTDHARTEHRHHGMIRPPLDVEPGLVVADHAGPFFKRPAKLVA